MDSLKSAYTGVHAMSLDSKNRLALPAKLKSIFAENAQHKEQVCALDIDPKRIIIADQDVLSDLIQDKDMRSLAPFIQPLSLKNDGRFVLSEDYRAHTGIHQDAKSAVFVGHNDHIAVYSEDDWNNYRENLLKTGLGQG